MTITGTSVKSRIRFNLRTLERFTSVLWRSWAPTVRRRSTLTIQGMTSTRTLPRHHLRKSTSSNCCPPTSPRRIITAACLSTSESSHRKLLVRNVDACFFGEGPLSHVLLLSLGTSRASVEEEEDATRMYFCFLSALPSLCWLLDRAVNGYPCTRLTDRW